MLDMYSYVKCLCDLIVKYLNISFYFSGYEIKFGHIILFTLISAVFIKFFNRLGD